MAALAMTSSPRRLAYDDDGGTNGRKALSISPSGTGDDHLTNKLIVRTQKRLPGEEVPSQLKSA